MTNLGQVRVARGPGVQCRQWPGCVRRVPRWPESAPLVAWVRAARGLGVQCHQWQP